MIKVKCICPTCGEEFYRTLSQIIQGKNKYCSSQCYRNEEIGKNNSNEKIKNKKSKNNKSKKIKCICKVCGKEFFVCKSRSKAKYCSRECTNASRSMQTGKNATNWKGGKIKCICKICGKEFFVDPYIIKSGGGKYCSNNCRFKGNTGENSPTWKGGKVKRVCQNCGKEFYVYLSYIKGNKGKYCSPRCRSVGLSGEKSPYWTRTKYICENCGKEFFVMPSNIKRGFDKYCSTKCAGIAKSGEKSWLWKGGTSFLPYCPKFNKRRKEAVRNFFGRKCLACGSDEIEFRTRLPVHHADHDKEQGCNGKPFNLVPLCPSCHSKEGHNEEEFKAYINKTLEEGFKWGVWSREEYAEKVMYSDE